MIRLLLETATDVCSVAIACGEEVLAERTAAEAYKHSSHLTVFIQESLQAAQLQAKDLDEIVLSDGPGSFTSLRVGAATAKGFCLALPGLGLRTVGSLTALLATQPANVSVLACLNSRRGEVFAQFRARPLVPGLVENKDLTQAHNLLLSNPEWHLPYLEMSKEGPVVVIGPGQERVREFLPEGVLNFEFGYPQSCSAIQLLAPAAAQGLSTLVDIAAYEPYYLNPPFVTKSKKKPLG